jgi:hypothetical protein
VPELWATRVQTGGGFLLAPTRPFKVLTATPRQALKGADTKWCKMSNPKKIDLAALLQEDDAPTNPPICLELECGNFAQPDDDFCAEHTGKQAVEAGRFPGPEKRSDRRGQPVVAGGGAMSGEKYTRAEVMAVINPEGKVPEKKGKLNKCIYCSDYTESDYGLDVTCFRHAEEKWKEHERKKARAVVSKQSVNKRKTMQSAMRERIGS